jgi:predicted SprT family Zn-dependent metalloprotease
MLNICYICGKESPIRKYVCKTCGKSGNQCNPCREKIRKEIAYVCWNCHNNIKEGDELK